MWLRLYSILIHLAFAAVLPWLLWTGWKKGKLKGGFGERFGVLKQNWVRELAGKKPIWIHAVSVGEAQMLPPVLGRLAEQYPDAPVMISTNTVTGHQAASSFPQARGVFYVPLDFGWAVGRVLDTLRPRLLIILETEIWPNLLAQSSRRGIPVVFLNGRISERSFGRYLRIRFFLSRILPLASAFGMRSEADAERIRKMGAPVERIHVLGNLKYESASQLLEGRGQLTREEFGLGPEDILLVGGSTFSGEEEMLVRIIKALQEGHPHLRLLLAPRHPERFLEAASVVEEAGLPLMRRSTGRINRETERPLPVLLLDVMGQLKYVYELADLVFMGKSMGFTPAGKGGQNPLEPAVWSKPVLCGEHFSNFEEPVRALLEAGGAVRVSSEEELLREIEELLVHPGKRLEMGKKAFTVIEKSLGATDHCLELIGKVLDNPSS
jgi:3-deoxy-D-manno-octulosonic-acid transferase